MPLLSTLVLLSLASLTLTSTPQLVATGSRDNSGECDCYLTSGPKPGYFQYYRFFDFRSIPDDDDDDFTDPPALVANSENQGSEPITNSYFNTSAWNENWSIETGNVTDQDNSYTQVESPQNIYISRNTSNSDQSTYLTLRTHRNPSFQSTAEMDCNQKNLMHSSIRARLRVIPKDEHLASEGDAVAPGAVVGFFIYESDTEESDIEILTSDPIGRIRYSNQPDYDEKTGNTVPGASTDYSMPEGKAWTEWLTHRLDWYPGVSQWWIDGELALNKTINVPKKPSGMILNVWSDGGEWSGNMTVGQEVTVGVEWIEMVFNISGNVNGPHKRWSDSAKGLFERKTKHCQVGCWVDAPEVTEVGLPVVAFNNTGDAGVSRVRDGANRLSTVYGMVLVSVMYTLFV